MTALAAARPSTAILGDSAVPNILSLPMKAATKIYQGGLVCIDAGYAAPARTALGLLCVGRAEETVDNTAGAAGDLKVRVRQGAFNWGNSSSGDLIAQANVGKLCYAVDDQTVALTDSNGARSPAGRIVAVDSTDGVWVLSGLSGVEAAAGFEEAGEVRSIVTLPLDLASIADGVVATFTPGFAGRIIKAQVVVTKPATTAAKLSTLQPRIAGVATTGGAVAITSANMTPVGNVVAGTAITAANEFTAAQAITILASATTAFVEGTASLLLSLG